MGNRQTQYVKGQLIATETPELLHSVAQELLYQDDDESQEVLEEKFKKLLQESKSLNGTQPRGNIRDNNVDSK